MALFRCGNISHSAEVLDVFNSSSNVSNHTISIKADKAYSKMYCFVSYSDAGGANASDNITATVNNIAVTVTNVPDTTYHKTDAGVRLGYIENVPANANVNLKFAFNSGDGHLAMFAIA